MTYWQAWEEVALAKYKWVPVPPLPKLDRHMTNIYSATLKHCLTAREVESIIEDWARTMEIPLDFKSPKVTPKYALATLAKYYGESPALTHVPRAWDGQWAISGLASTLS